MRTATFLILKTDIKHLFAYLLAYFKLNHYEKKEGNKIPSSCQSFREDKDAWSWHKSFWNTNTAIISKALFLVLTEQIMDLKVCAINDSFNLWWGILLGVLPGRIIWTKNKMKKSTVAHFLSIENFRMGLFISISDRNSVICPEANSAALTILSSSNIEEPL